ncbi:ATP-binding cassette domain-containing protein [Variovorax guangxiensis]|nr:ATP-binding cassette domain-containing protein [Variovorax guangxiensis]
MGSVLSLRGLCISYGDHQVLSQVNLEIPEKGITVLLGPSGTGKSTLLRTIAGENTDHPSIRVEGRIDYVLQGQHPPLVMQKAKLLLATVFENLVHDWPERARLTHKQQYVRVTRWLAELQLEHLLPNLHMPVVGLPLADQRLMPLLRRAMVDSPLLLLDEPTAGLSSEQAGPILALLRRFRQQRSVLVAMHNLSQSRSIADGVVLLASRHVQEHSGARLFFNRPLSEAGRLFLCTGSCPEGARHSADRSSAPELAAIALGPQPPRPLGPNGFVWLVPGQLAGMPWPGLLRSATYDLDLLQACGVTRLLSLTDRPFPGELARSHGLVVENSPITDMQPPEVSQAIKLCQRIEALMASGEVIAVHCHAGLGRTGTMLAAYWIWRHQGRISGEVALQQVRRIHPGWVQSVAQIDFLRAFAPAIERMRSVTTGSSLVAKSVVLPLHQDP